MGYKRLIIAGLLLTSFSLQAKELVNALTVGQSQLISFSSSYGGSWSPANLTDGMAEKGWASKENEPTPHKFVYELKSNTLISRIVVDNRGTEEKTITVFQPKKFRSSLQIKMSKRPIARC